jgi:tRNA(Ile)-lysidine synthase
VHDWHSDAAWLARERKQSIEVAARQARYQFLASTAASLGTQYIAVAHNADDQAETVLMRLIRGTGISGLSGMRKVNPLHDVAGVGHAGMFILRPLLGVSRAEIESYCRVKRLQPRHDATNDELHHTRNRVRHELLPLLEQYNPGIRKVLTRLAETATTDLEIIDYASQQAYSSVLALDTPDRTIFSRAAWRALPPGLQRAVLREAVRRFKGDVTDLKYAAVEEARDVLNSDAGSGEIAILSDVRIVVSQRSFYLEVDDAIHYLPA